MMTEKGVKPADFTVPDDAPDIVLDVVPRARQLLTAQALISLNQRSNFAGALRLCVHLSIMVLSGYSWGHAAGLWRVPALIVYGASLALMFCAVHECVHRTAFVSTGG